MTAIPIYLRQFVFISVPMLAGIACIWVSYRDPDGEMRSLWLPGTILVFFGLYVLGVTLGLFGGNITIPAN